MRTRDNFNLMMNRSSFLKTFIGILYETVLFLLLQNRIHLKNLTRRSLSSLSISVRMFFQRQISSNLLLIMNQILKGLPETVIAGAAEMRKAGQPGRKMGLYSSEAQHASFSDISMKTVNFAGSFMMLISHRGNHNDQLDNKKILAEYCLSSCQAGKASWI